MAALGVETIRIENREQWLALRMHDITASDIGTICGYSLYSSPAKIFALKKGLIPPDEETNAMRRGRWGEAAVFEAIADMYPHLEVKRAKVYLRDPAARIGCTPDGVAIDPEKPGIMVVQCKVISANIFRDHWLAEPLNDDPHDLHAEASPPMAYQLQTLTEGMLVDAACGLLAVLIVDTFRWTLRLFYVQRHAGAEATIRNRVAAFWHDFLDCNVMPQVSGETDADVVKAMYPRDDGTEIDLSADNQIGELVETWKQHLRLHIDFEKSSKAARTEIAAKMGAHAYGRLPDGRMLTLKVTERAELISAATSFRTLRIQKAK